MTTVADKVRKDIRQNIGLYLFIVVTVVFMLFGIIWVYHVKVLNAPKVYSDGFGYYLYLPAVIHGDFSFSFIEGWEHPFDLMEVPGGKIDKYPIGVAIMESPFFFLAHAVCLVKDTLTGSITATGYSNLYQYMILFGGVLYWMAGTLLLYKLLNTFLAFSKRVSLISCIVITYGTNLFHYASYDACFSHVYSYFLFNLFLFYLCWYESREEEGKNKLMHICIFGFLAGLIFMCRNTNIVFVVNYIFYGVRNIETLRSRIVTVLCPSRAVPIVLTGMITLLPQLLYWHAATGHWFVYSYGANEPFYWLSPQIVNFLFSVRKGLLFWSPLLFFALAGIFVTYRKCRQLYVGLVVFLVLIIYISSAWWSWYYGGSFGQRVAVDFMCVFAVFIAGMFDRLEGWQAQGRNGYRLWNCLACGYCAVCILWNLWCMMAYWYRVLPSDGSDWSTLRDIIGMIR